MTTIHMTQQHIQIIVHIFITIKALANLEADISELIASGITLNVKLNGIDDEKLVAQS